MSNEPLFTTLADLTPNTSFVSADNAFTSNEEVSKSQLLEQVKEEKLKALDNLKNGTSLDDSFTQLEDGRLLSNKNKVWNDLSGLEIQSTLDAGLSNYGLTQDDQGNTFLPDGTPYTGRTRRLYMFGTKDGTNDAIKLGVASGHTEGAEERYIPKFLGYGWDSGELGADTSKKQLDVLLPHNVATTLEGLIHGRKNALEGRIVKDKFENYETYNDYGSGGTEYYKNRDALLGAPVETDQLLGQNLLDKYLNTINKNPLSTPAEVEDNLLTSTSKGLHRLGNTAKGFASTFISELLVNPADFIGDQTGLYDLGTEEEKTQAVQDFTGYEDKFLQQTVEDIHKDWDVISNSEVPVATRLKAAGNAVLNAITTPELLGTSFGALAAWMLPGGVLTRMAGGTKYLNRAKEIQGAVKSGKMTKDAARAENRANFLSIDGARHLLLQQSGFVTSAMGNVNNQYEQFVANNNGQELEGKEKAQWFATRFGVQMVNQNLDKITDLNVLRSPGVIKALVPAFKNMTNKEFSNALKVAGKGLLGTFTNMGKEAAQEYSQTMMELHNARFGSEQFKDADTYAKFLADDRNLDEAAVAGLMGIGGSVQFEAVGAMNPLGYKTPSLNNILNKDNPAPTADTIANLKESAATATGDKETYSKLLAGTAQNVVEGKMNANNINAYLDDLDKLNEMKHVIRDSTPEAVAEGENAYKLITTGLKDFIVNNPELKLTRGVVQKTLEESVEDNVAKKAVEALPEETQTAFKNFASLMGDGTELQLETSIKNTINTFNKKYDEVVKEEELIAPYIKNLEQSLTGKTSETTEDSFDTVRKTLKESGLLEATKGKKKPTSKEDIVNKHSFGEDTVLGSSPSSNNEIGTDEEFEYDDYKRAVVAERLLNAVLGSDPDIIHDQEVITKMLSFARTNKVREDDLNYLVKSYESVEEEATMGKTGYVPQLVRLKGLVESSNMNKEAFAKGRSKLVDFQASLNNSIAGLGTGIKQAEAKAAEYNRNKAAGALTKAEYIKTDYMKYNPTTGEYDVPFDITVSKNKETGKWEAHTAVAKDLLSRKKTYVKHITKGLRDVSARAESKIPGIADNVGIYTVPTTTGTRKKVRDKDAAYISKIGDTLKDLTGSRAITKVIVGDKHSDKWKSKNSYAKTNNDIINNTDATEFSEDDVVLINSFGTRVVGKTANKKGYAKPDIVAASNAPIDKITDAQHSFKAATDAGSTFVLDMEHNPYGFTAKDKAARNATIALKKHFKDKGYEVLEGSDRHIYIKENDKNKDTIKKWKEDLAKEKKTTVDRRNDKNNLVSIRRSIDSNVNRKTGKELTSDEVIGLEAAYKELHAKVTRESFKAESDNVDKFVKNALTKDVDKEVQGIIEDADAPPLDTNDKAYEAAVMKRLKEKQDSDVAIAAVLEEWKHKIEVEQLTGKKAEQAKVDALAKIGAAPRQNIEKILHKDNSIAVGKKDLYEVVYMRGKDRLLRTKHFKSDPTPEMIEKHTSMGAQTWVANEPRRVVQDVTKLVNVNKTTVLNSTPVEALPSLVKNYVERFDDAGFKALAKVGETELDAQGRSKGDNGKWLTEGFHLYNSVARGLIFNNKGEFNQEVLAAMSLAIGDLIATDMHKLTKGYKNDDDIANMFGIQKEQVTPELRNFVKNHGSYLKTVASSVGKNVLKQLGLSKRIDSETSANEYEALVADIGNSAILLGEQIGLLEKTKEESNAIAGIIKADLVDEKNGKPVTHFVNIKADTEVKGDFVNHTPTKAVTDFNENFKELAKAFPEAQMDKKIVSFNPPSQKKLDKVYSSVLNDKSNLTIPEQAKDTLKHQMETPIKYDSARVDEFLDAYYDERYNIKGQLGYVKLGTKKYNDLSFEEKEVQESINRDIDNSIEHIEELKEIVRKRKETDPDFYMDYRYVLNQRYNLDSNTINIQTRSKIDRFLFSPTAHDIQYSIKSKKGALLFESKSKNGGTTDQNFPIRMALSQAMGQGVDKMSYKDIINFGDALLSLDKDQLQTVKDTLFSKKEMELHVKGLVDPLKLEVEHAPHVIQALDFLRKAQEAKTTGKSFNSSLSMEFDSLTSGFANKIQQFPILDDMKNYYARTGVLTPKYQKILEDAVHFKGSVGASFDPKQGDSVADVLAAGTDIGFLDSYQDLASKIIGILRKETNQNKHLSVPTKEDGLSGQTVFNAIKQVLPGGEYTSNEEDINKIGGPLRNLFKYPFMIFNYSGSIKSIVNNLGTDVANDMVKNITALDLTSKDDKDLLLQQSAQNLLDTVTILDSNENRVTSVEAFQGLLREKRLSSIKIKSFRLGTDEKRKQGQQDVKPKNLQALLEDTVKLTYGKSVEEVFDKQFAPFIDVQNAINDNFKIAFRIFDHKRVTRLKEILKESDKKIITVEDHKKVIDELWNDFPWLRGPLSKQLKDGLMKDVIAIVDTSTRTPNPIESSRSKPQTVLGTASKTTKTLTVTPLVSVFEEALSAGSVLPFHAIDGAEMSSTILDLGIKGITSIHDAVIAPLDQSDAITFLYNKNMHSINSDYKLYEALEELSERINKTISEEKFDVKYKKLRHDGLKVSDYKDKEETFPTVAKKAIGKLQEQVKKIKDAREKYYGKDGILANSYYGNMIPTPGGMFKPGQTDPDLSYKKEFTSLYKDREVTFDEDATTNFAKEQYNENDIIDVIESAGYLTDSTKNALLKTFKHYTGTTQERIDEMLKFLDGKATSVSPSIVANMKTLKGEINDRIGDKTLFAKDSDAENIKNEQEATRDC